MSGPSTLGRPTITALVTAYNAQDHIADTLRSILAQTCPPDEIVVVDDGSTDGSADVVRTFGDRVRMVWQPNAGHAPALNRGYRESRCDYVAQCDADDLWEPDKLERQLAALERHPEIDIHFTGVWIFGAVEGPWGILDGPCAEGGLLDPVEFARALYQVNSVCPSTTLVRRSLYERLGPYAEELPFVDYHYWFRSLRAGATFYYDPHVTVRYRRHDQQMTANALKMWRSMHDVRTEFGELVDDDLRRTIRGADLFRIGRLLADLDDAAAGRAAFWGSARATTRRTLGTGARALAWTGLLTLPGGARDRLTRAAVGASRGLDAARGGRDPALP